MLFQRFRRFYISLNPLFYAISPYLTFLGRLHMAEVGGSNPSSLPAHAIELPTTAAAPQFVLAIGLNVPERVQ